jgi:uncharacterized membrane protein YeaQ/YmgE (transglycosylase-associated protein family)
LESARSEAAGQLQTQDQIVVNLASGSPARRGISFHVDRRLKTMNIIIWIIVGIVAGWLAGLIARGRGFGLIGDFVIGLIGGIIGGWLASIVGLFPTTIIGQIIVAAIGGAILVWIIRAIRYA